MALLKSDCLDAFLRAWAALDKIATSPKATDAQAADAERAREDLAHDFIRSNLDTLEERTKLFARFVTEMERVIDAIKTEGPIQGLKTLESITDDAAALIETIAAATTGGVPKGTDASGKKASG